MNKADNEAGNAAIDSLLNYETVKVSFKCPTHTHTCTHLPNLLLELTLTKHIDINKCVCHHLNIYIIYLRSIIQWP